MWSRCGDRLGVAVLVTAASFLFGCERRVGPMEYCRGLEERGLAQDCALQSNATGGAVATFKTRGGPGRLLVTDSRGYSARTLEILDRKYKGGIYVAEYGGASDYPVAVLVEFPGTVDVFDREGIEAFQHQDLGDIKEGKALRPRQQPSKRAQRSPACSTKEDGTLCSGAGLCSVTAEKPNNCFAGFDEDCRKSTGCVQHGMCRASVKTGLCEK